MIRNEFGIPVIEPSQRIWVVRADNGKYLNNFLEHGVASIGHADILNFPEVRGITANKDDLAAALSEKYALYNSRNSERTDFKPVSRSKITQDHRQISTFINEMKVGDLIVTPTQRTLSVGVIQSHAYTCKDCLSYQATEDVSEIIELKHHLRRDVKWMPTFSRNRAPKALFPFFTGHSTVFELTQNKDAFYHLFYPVYVCGENVHAAVSFYQNENLDGYSIASLGGFIARLEVLARNADTPIEDFEDFFQEFLRTNDIIFTDKAHYLSKGKTFYTFAALGAGAFSCLLFYGLGTFISGGTFEATYSSDAGFRLNGEINPLITPEQRDNLARHLFNLKEEFNSERVNQKLLPKLEGLDSTTLEGEIEDEEEVQDIFAFVG